MTGCRSLGSTWEGKKSSRNIDRWWHNLKLWRNLLRNEKYINDKSPLIQTRHVKRFHSQGWVLSEQNGVLGTLKLCYCIYPMRTIFSNTYLSCQYFGVYRCLYTGSKLQHGCAKRFDTLGISITYSWSRLQHWRAKWFDTRIQIVCTDVPLLVKQCIKI